MKKRFLAMLLAAMMVVSLAGCGKEEEPAQPVLEPEPVAEPQPEPEPEQPEKKSGSGLLAVVALLVLAGGGAFAYVKFIKPNRSGVKVSADPDEYDFPDEEYINEDEPAEAETEAEHE